MSLKKKTINGLIWTFTQQISVQLINLIAGIILARILTPYEFGLIGMLSIFMALGITLLDSGMTSSLIRTPNPDNVDYSTVFFINITFSFFVYILIFYSAPFIAEFYKQSILTKIVRVYTLAFIIRAMVSVQTTRLTKEMRFKEQLLMQIPSTLIGGIIGIIMAKKGLGVWSLVWMYLIQAFLFAIQHWFFSGWRPQLIVNIARLKYHLKFGYKLTLSSIIDTIYTNLYQVVIGRFFSASVLGFYTQAKNLQSLPVNNITTALDKVTYPMFASIHNDEKLRDVYKRILHLAMFIIVPMMLCAIVIARPLFLTVLTNKWLPSVPFFQLLCITGILYPFHLYNLNILNVKGRSDLFLKLEIIKKIFISIGIPIALYFGIYGLLIFQIISSCFAFFINTFYTGKFLNYSGVQQILEISPIIFIAIISGIATWGVRLFLENSLISNFYVLALSIIVFFLFYFFLSFSFKVQAIKELKLASELRK